MVFRCNRLGYLFVRRTAKEALGIYGGFFLLPSLAFILFFGADVLKIWIFFPLFFALATVITLVSLLFMPRQLTFENKQLTWEEKLNVRYSEIERYVLVLFRINTRIAAVTVGNLREIEFLQTPVERLFNIGRIRFRGDIRSLEASKPVVNPAIPFYYGGIRRYDRFKECLTRQLSPSAFQSK